MLYALDLATNTGEAWGVGDSLPTLAHVKLPSTGEDVGKFIAAFADHVIDRIDTICPSLVCFESPILPKQGVSLITARKLYGLGARLEEICCREGLPCCEVQPATVKKALTGSGRAEKHQMVNACRAYGLDPHTYTHGHQEASDEADAFGVWLTALRERRPQHAARWPALPGPLFERAA